MNVFQPNNHSKWKIDYRPVTEENALALKKVFLARYPSQADNVFFIEQVAEIEANSNNFKISVLKEESPVYFLLRRYPENRDISSVMGTHEVLRYLKEHNLKAPEIVKADSGEDIAAEAPYSYTLFKFLKADHYRGTLEELESAAEEFGKMDSLLSRLPNKEKLEKMVAFPEKFLQLREFSVSVWKNIFEAAEKHYQNTHEEFDAKLLSLKDFISEAVGKTPSEIYGGLPKQIIHFDLHPHNLLTDGNELVAILDFDSLRHLERMRGVAFAMHRLARQHIVFSKPKDIKSAVDKAREIFLRSYQKTNVLTREELDATAYFLRHESLSRLSYAMKDFYFNGNGAWKADLDKQTAAIAEAGYFEK